LVLSFPHSLTHPNASAQILKEVGQKIQSYPFNYNGAAILSGQAEGAYGWVTVNYLLENLIKVQGGHLFFRFFLLL
jgi:Golgi nucleoside diphosphatase